MVGVTSNTMQSTMQALAMSASRKNVSRNFKEAFARVLLNETGVTLSAGAVSQESMDRELQMALRLAGYSGDTVAGAADAGPPDESNKVGTWSDDAEELMKLVQQLGPRNPNLSSEQYLKPFFRHLCLPSLAIRELDDDVARFARLRFLDVSQNNLTCIDNVPPNLKYLKAYNNPISQISCKPTPSLCFLGLGYSKIGSDGLEQAARRFKNLLSLDLCFSEVANFQEVVTPLAPLPKLRHLCLAGSPVGVLPFYRVQVLRWLPQLHVLDGVAAADEEQADVQMLVASSAPLRQRPQTLRFGLQLQKLVGLRRLLEPVAEAILEERSKRAPAEEAAPPPEAEEQDDIVKACASGSLRLKLELPDGTWTETSEYRFRNLEELAAIRAAAGEGGPPPLDEIFLAGIGTPVKEPLYFDLDVGEEGSEVHGEVLQEDGLLRLARWLRKGLAVKFFFREAPPKAPEGEAAAAPPASEGAEGEEGENAAPAAPELPEEVELGGTVLALDVYLWRSGTDVAEEARAAGQLPESPAPWRLEVTDAQVALTKDFLQPGVQVPPMYSKAAKKFNKDDISLLSVVIELHAGDAPPLQEEPPPPTADPKAKAKAKK
mmetsp:Transcript_73325/g.185720  ORF Transcript_73325/g.185720 Transcript_73325/m.185720 type:complete len:603 (-) Transcript_73325:71-1879(-)